MIYEDGKTKEAADREILAKFDKVAFALTTALQHSIFSIAFDNALEADEAEMWIRRLNGVKRVKAGIMREFIVVEEWLDEEIVRNLSK